MCSRRIVVAVECQKPAVNVKFAVINNYFRSNFWNTKAISGDLRYSSVNKHFFSITMPVAVVF